MNNRLVNRLTFPTRHVLVCEDNTEAQARIARHLADVFGPEGDVHVSIVSGAVAASGLLTTMGAELVLLDHDMPYGNGPDLLEWLRATGRNVPVITFSGIPGNNDNLMACGAHYRFMKDDVIDGAADALMRQLLGV